MTRRLHRKYLLADGPKYQKCPENHLFTFYFFFKIKAISKKKNSLPSGDEDFFISWLGSLTYAA